MDQSSPNTDIDRGTHNTSPSGTATTEANGATAERHSGVDTRCSLSRRTVLQAGVIAGAALTGLGTVGATSAGALSAGESRWTYGETELECSPPPETFQAAPTVVDGYVYAGTTCGFMHIIDAASGDEVDTIYTSASTDKSPNIAGDMIAIVPNNDDLGVYELLGGGETDRLWESDVGGSVTTLVSSPTIYDGTVYTTNHDGPPYLHASDLWSGDLQWSYDGEELGESPVIVDGVVYATGQGGTLVALDANSGDEEWEFGIGAEAEAAPTVSDGLVFVGSTAGTLYAVDAATGDEEWHFDTDGDITTAPTVFDGMVYVGSYDEHLYAIDAATGDEEWRFNTGELVSSAPTVVDDRVFVGTQEAKVFAVDTSSGEEQWQFAETELDEELFLDTSDPIVVDGVLYVATSDGQEGRIRALDAGVSGSSEDSRVMLGTTGHHDAWSETAAATGGPDDGENGESGGDDQSGSAGDGDGSSGGTTDGSSGGASDGSDDADGVGFGIGSALAGVAGTAYLLGQRVRGEDR